eukprot:3587913-Prymnesium_polylepis.1
MGIWRLAPAHAACVKPGKSSFRVYRIPRVPDIVCTGACDVLGGDCTAQAFHISCVPDTVPDTV